MPVRQSLIQVVVQARSLLPGLLVGALAMLLAAGCGGESRGRVQELGGPEPVPYFDRMATLYDGSPFAVTPAEFTENVVWAGLCASKNPASDAQRWILWGAALLVDPATKEATVLGGTARARHAYLSRTEAKIREEAAAAGHRDVIDTLRLDDAADGNTRFARSQRTRVARTASALDFGLRRIETPSGAVALVAKGVCSNEAGCRLGETVAPIPAGQAYIYCVFTRNKTTPDPRAPRGEEQIDRELRRKP